MFGTSYQLENSHTDTQVRVAWILPQLGPGSGGLLTIIQNANYLATKGYLCDIYVKDTPLTSSQDIKNAIIRMYGRCLCTTYSGAEVDKYQYDIVFATAAWNTVLPALESSVPHKAYFIQDFEPWFDPMGLTYINMERTYTYGLEGISIGRWLDHKLTRDYGMSMHHFDFCADRSIYHRLDTVKKENAVCFVFQPEKPRRCANLGILALSLVKQEIPDVAIYLFGSNVDYQVPSYMKNLKLLTWTQCNELYNRCKVGLSFSSSNPSRIPFEMMSAGLPVVELYRENNLYDMPEDGVLLADPTPEAIANAILSILRNETVRTYMSEAGYRYMEEHPLEKGFEQFGEFVGGILTGRLPTEEHFEKSYHRETIRGNGSFSHIDLNKQIKGPWKKSETIIILLCVLLLLCFIQRNTLVAYFEKRR